MASTSVRTQRSPIRVYLIEDSEAIRELIYEDFAAIPGIAMAGYATTESDAMSRLGSERFDVIIFDIQLAQGNGINLLRTLARSNQQSGAVKVVFSNHVDDPYRRLCEQYGARYFFDKASEYSRLRDVVAQMAVAGMPC